MNHKVKIVEHLIIGHHNWVQDASVKKEIRLAKEMIQENLNLVSIQEDLRKTI